MPPSFFCFADEKGGIYALLCRGRLAASSVAILGELLEARPQLAELPATRYVGFHSHMVSPWCTQVREIIRSVGVEDVLRIEYFRPYDGGRFDGLLERAYERLDAAMFRVAVPVPVAEVLDVPAYLAQAGLSLTNEEGVYLQALAERERRLLTDAEVYGYAQVQAEHCRHKIFNSAFVLDGMPQRGSLFDKIKATTRQNPGRVVTAYTDNVAFLRGVRARQFHPRCGDKPSEYTTRTTELVCTLKAETHNFPTTVEPVYGAGTGTGGELRDRMAGGTGSIPLGGVALYMTAYSRLAPHKPWEHKCPERPWRYQSPADLLIGASNGASDYGNKFGQPLVCGSLLTFEHQEAGRLFAYDKVVMLAGGVGVGDLRCVQKKPLSAGQKIVLLGGDNYRIGMGGSAVSSVATGSHRASLEQQAVQRANPEMQKRVANVIRFFVECGKNPIVSIHDHGAGGHLNCFLEMIAAQGGIIYTDQLPIGDSSLAEREKILNESQERMGLVVEAADVPVLQAVCQREQAPCYVVGEVQAHRRIIFKNRTDDALPVHLGVADLMGAPPLPPVVDATIPRRFRPVEVDDDRLIAYVQQTLRADAVASKDWLTNKVDRSVGGKVVKQPCCGPLQLPLNNLGVLALEHEGQKGVATALGHAPVAGLIDPMAGAQLSLVEALTNIVWAPLAEGLQGISCSANWMWPSQPGDRADLYRAVEALAAYACALGVNIPTGKDSLFMDQLYAPPMGKVSAPGTVTLLATGLVEDIRQVVEPVLCPEEATALFYLPLGTDFSLGGSTLAQTLNRIGDTAPTPQPAEQISRAFHALQVLLAEERICSGHDVSAGGLITTLLELCFSSPSLGMRVDLSCLKAPTLTACLLSESPGWVVQGGDDLLDYFKKRQVPCFFIGRPVTTPTLFLKYHQKTMPLTFPLTERYGLTRPFTST